MGPGSGHNLDNNVGLTHHFQTALRRFELTPPRVTILYLLIGFSALYGSDVLLVKYFEDPLLSRLQGIKGAGEVVLTAGFIFGITRGSRAPLELETDRLERQREELEVLHRILRHNLRNDLNVICGYTELLQEHTTNEELRMWCDDIIDNVNDLLDYTEKANLVREISNKQVSKIDLATTIPRVIENNQHLTKADEVSVSLPDHARVEANHMLDVAIDELLTNAVEHNDPADVSVSLTVDPATAPISTTQIVIEDDGSGIPENELQVLSKRTENALTHMSGLGLWMVHWTVIESNGTMQIDTDDTGTRIVLSVPTAMEIPNESMAKAFG